MRDLLARLPLTGMVPLVVTGLLCVLGFALAVVGRARPGYRRAGTTVTAVGGVLLLAFGANTVRHRYQTAADLAGLPRYPDVQQIHPTGSRELEDGAVGRISVPDTASHFGQFDAQVYLPPQYFSQPTERFPVVILTHGNPGTSLDWLDGGGAEQTGQAVARSGHPVILVMPTVLQEPNGDSLCVDTASQGNAATYVLTDVVAAADSQLRTIPDAAHRAIGGFSMGGFCALNLGLKHPDVFSVVLSFSSLTVCRPDAIDGGNEALFGTPDWMQQVAANSPADYYSSLSPDRGPALWLDVGDEETELTGPLEELASGLRDRGFTVELHERPGGHDMATWGPALAEALPWAAARW